MASVTEERINFESEPISNKSIDAVPFVGKEAAEIFRVNGIDKASQLFGYFLINESALGAFIKIACEKGGMKEKDAKDVFELMKAYKRNNM